MAIITPSDFSKIWASNADTPEYTFTEADYLKGWDFVGNLPPTRAQWNAMQKSTDEKMKYVFDNFGAPLLANTVAEMTMQNRVYVYTGSETGYTAGHWYYWNGSWTDGGVYNSNTVQVDPTLTITGAAADAKAAGDSIQSIGDASLLANIVGVTSTANGWKINPATGLCSSNSGFKLLKYAVTEGNVYKIVSDESFQFQDSASVPSTGASHRLGETFASGTYFKTAPTGATYLILCSPTSSTNTAVYNMTTDKTLSVSNKPADAERTGEVFGDVADVRILDKDFVDGYYINTEYSFGDVVDITNLDAGSGRKYIIAPVKQGEHCIVTSYASTGTASRNYMFTDLNYRLLQNAMYNVTTVSDEDFYVSVDGYFFVNANDSHPFGLRILRSGTDNSNVVNQIRENISAGYRYAPYFTIIKNGTLVNVANANCVRTWSFVSVNPQNVVKLLIKKPLQIPTNQYYYTFQTYDENLTIVRNMNNSEYSVSVPVVIEQGEKYIRFSIWEKDNDGVTDPVRETDFGETDVVVNVGASENDDGDDGIYEHKKQEIDVFRIKRTSNEGWGQCDFKGLIISDVHAESQRFANAINLIEEWGTDYFDALLNLGDTAQLTLASGLMWHDNQLENIIVPYLNTVGNHDAYENTIGVLAPATTVYQAIIKPIEGQGFVQPSDAEVNGYNYYYWDKNGVRIVVLDCMFWNDAQKTWLDSVLADALTNNMAVVCMTHAAFNSTYMQHVPSVWSQINSVYNANALNIAAAESVKTFINNGGEFICWLSGHQHRDNLNVLPNYNNQMVVTLPSFAQRSGNLMKNENALAYNYNCLTYMAIDRYYHTAKFLRIGADIDMWGVKHEGLILDYANRTLIAAW